MNFDTNFFKSDVQLRSEPPADGGLTNKATAVNSSKKQQTDQSVASWPLTLLTAGMLATGSWAVPPMATTGPPVIMSAAVQRAERTATAPPDDSSSWDRLRSIVGRLTRQEKPIAEQAFLARAERVAEATEASPSSSASELEVGVRFIRVLDDA